MAKRFVVYGWKLGRKGKKILGHSDDLAAAQRIVERQVDQAVDQHMVITRFARSAHIRSTKARDASHIVRIEEK